MINIQLKYFLLVIGFGILAISSTNNINGQNVNNPFEIKNRIIENSVSILEPMEEVDTVVNQLSTENIELISAEELTTHQNIDLSDGNPFEVDHIPLRKKDVIDKQINQNESQENITKPISKSFIYWVILIGLILLTLATTSNRKLFGKVLKAIFNENILKQEQRGGASLTLEYILLYLVFFINGGIFVMLVWNYFYGGVVSFKYFSYSSALLIGIYTVRHISMNLLGMIFPVKKEAKLYSFTIQLFNAFIGIILIPINLFLAFGSENLTKVSLLIGLGFVSLLLIIRVIRGLTIALNFVFNSLILFFVYLCTLEIAPILVLVKVLSKIS